MNLQITGRLHAKFPTQQIKDTFSKRDFVLELTEENSSGMVFTNYASFQLVNQSCAILDNFQEGESLVVSFSIRGNKWERDGQVKYITNLAAWRIERVGQNATPPPQQEPQPRQPMQANTFQPQQGSLDEQMGQNADDGLPF